MGIALCAVAAGTFARFKGLGAAPLAVDEYFIVRSTQNLLHHGWPAFDCGGLYTRGLLLQYLSALLNLLGVSAETSPRILSAASSLCVLPAAYVLGRRAHSSTVGWLAVTVLALSVWEVEMARFGRMYAPFQMVFLWYVVFFLKFTVDRDARAAWPMAVLTVIGALLWEGGVLLGLANFLPLFLQRFRRNFSRCDWPYFAKSAVLLAVVYWFVTTDFRLLGNSPALPLDYDPSLTSEWVDVLQAPLPAWTTLWAHPAWLVVFVAALVAVGLSFPWIWIFRKRVVASIGVIAVLVASLEHQFLAAGALLVVLVLFRLISWRELLSRDARSLHAALAACAVFWLACLGTTWHIPATVSAAKGALVFTYQFASFPDVIGEVVRPWTGALPILGLGLALVLGVSLVRVTTQNETGVSPQRALWAVFLCLLLAASASHPPRHETRYVFFLYPVAIILALSTIAEIIESIPTPRRATIAVAVAISVGAFMLTDDFEPRHLLAINRPDTMFRFRLTPAQQSHYVIRDDTRALARWLGEHAASDGDTVVNAVQGLDYYDSKIDYFYVDRSDFNFPSYACRLGTIDRWSNLPLLQTVPALDAAIASSRQTFLVTYANRLEALLPRLAARHPRIVWSSGHLLVVAFDGGSVRPTLIT
jgi:hypothetical protein